MRELLIFTAISVCLIAGFRYGIKTRNKPEIFWTYLIIGLIFTTPLMFGGYTWYDEFFTAAFLLTALPKSMKIKIRAYHLVFIFLCAYMFVQSIRGIVFFSHFGFMDALTKIRWIFFILIIFLVFLKGISFKIANAFDENLPYSLTKAGLLFNIIYLSYGLLSLHITGSTAFTQAAMISEEYRIGTSPFLAIFGSTGYVVSVYLVFIPAVLITINNDIQSRVNVGWLTLALSLMTQMMYNSRSGMMMIAIFSGLFIGQYLLRKRVIKGFLLFIPLLAFSIIFQVFFNEVNVALIFQDFLNTLHLGNISYYNPSLQDINRKVWNTSAVVALLDNPYNFLFGWGLRSGGYIVAPYVYDLFVMALGSANYKEGVGTPGFAALAVDMGFIGLLLILISLIFCIVSVYRLCGKIEFFLLFAPISFILQLFVMNIFDVLFLYLAIMPGGIFIVLAKCNRIFSRLPKVKTNTSIAHVFRTT